MSNNTKAWWVCIVFAVIAGLLGESDKSTSFFAAAMVLAGLDKEK